MACSALKKSYRNILVGSVGYKPRGQCVLILLQGRKDVIMERMKQRKDHFMPDSLLQSQFDILELPGNEETSITCDVTCSTENVVTDDIIQQIRKF